MATSISLAKNSSLSIILALKSVLEDFLSILHQFWAENPRAVCAWRHPTPKTWLPLGEAGWGGPKQAGGAPLGALVSIKKQKWTSWWSSTFVQWFARQRWRTHCSFIKFDNDNSMNRDAAHFILFLMQIKILFWSLWYFRPHQGWKLSYQSQITYHRSV